MFTRRLGIVVAALTLVLVAGGAAACSGGGDDDGDEAKIESRTKSFFDHLVKADAKGLINDLPPSVRSGCDEAKIKEGASELSKLKFTLKGTKVTSVNGNNATADITTSLGEGEDKLEDTSAQKYVKVDGTWYMDNEGKSCAEFFG